MKDAKAHLKVLWISQLSGQQFGLKAEAELVLGLRKRGLDIEVLCSPDSRFIPEFEAVGIPVDTRHPTSKWSRTETRALRKKITEGAFSVIHAFNNKAIMQAVRACRGLDVKLLTYRGFAGHIHWYDPLAYLSHLHPRVDGIMCLSYAVQRYMDRQFVYRKPPTRTIYKGQDPSWYKEARPIGKKALGLPDDAYAVVLVANYRRYKGVDDLVGALNYLPVELPIRFVLVGRDMDHPRMQALLAKIPGPERVHRLGFRKDVLDVVASCDLAVNVSWTEALSKTLFEAIFLGIPCLATAVSGNLEMIRDEELGWQVPVRDPEAIARAILEAYQDPKEAQRRAGNARDYIATTFRTDASAEAIELWYRELLSV